MATAEQNSLASDTHSPPLYACLLASIRTQFFLYEHTLSHLPSCPVTSYMLNWLWRLPLKGLRYWEVYLVFFCESVCQVFLVLCLCIGKSFKCDRLCFCCTVYCTDTRPVSAGFLTTFWITTSPQLECGSYLAWLYLWWQLIGIKSDIATLTLQLCPGALVPYT